MTTVATAGIIQATPAGGAGSGRKTSEASEEYAERLAHCWHAGTGYSEVELDCRPDCDFEPVPGWVLRALAEFYEDVEAVDADDCEPEEGEAEI
jgi:hypothetical protein